MMTKRERIICKRLGDAMTAALGNIEKSFTSATPLLSVHLFEHDDEFSFSVDWNGQDYDPEREARLLRWLIEDVKDHICALEQQ